MFSCHIMIWHEHIGEHNMKGSRNVFQARFYMAYMVKGSVEVDQATLPYSPVQ